MPQLSKKLKENEIPFKFDALYKEASEKLEEAQKQLTYFSGRRTIATT